MYEGYNLRPVFITTTMLDSDFLRLLFYVAFLILCRGDDVDLFAARRADWSEPRTMVVEIREIKTAVSECKTAQGQWPRLPLPKRTFNQPSIVRGVGDDPRFRVRSPLTCTPA